jgi:hypothetical protein
LNIENVTLDDDGVYQCQIGRTVEAREVLSHMINLTVLIVPNEIRTSYVPPGLVISGKEFRVQCDVFNTRPAMIFTWKTPVNAHIVNITQSNEPINVNSKLLKSSSIIALVADVSQHGHELTCQATHTALNKSLMSSIMIAVDCNILLVLVIERIRTIEHDISYRSTYCEDQSKANKNAGKS